MATRFSHSTRIGGRLEAIHSALSDEAFWADRIKTAGSSKDSLDDFAVHGDTIEVTVTQFIPDSDIPDIARKVLPGELSIVRQASYSGIVDDRITGSSRAEAVGGLGVITGSGQAVPDGDEAVESLSGQVKVTVPLLGGRLEKLVVDHMNKLFAKEYEHMNRWIAAH